MANLDISNRPRVIDKRRGRGVATDTHAAGTNTNFRDINSMRTRLTAISGTTYSAANLDKMTHNDMVRAIILNDEAAGVNI